jgi:hypothetical protein
MSPIDGTLALLLGANHISDMAKPLPTVMDLIPLLVLVADTGLAI